MTVQKIGKIIAIVGAILIYGAIGAADCGTVTLTRFLIAIACRVAITLFGLYLANYEKPEEIEEIELD